MKNSTVKSASLFLPSLRSTERRVFDNKINSVETLPRMVNKLSIDKSLKRNTAYVDCRLNQDSKTREKITESDFKLTAASLYDIDGMSYEDLQATLCRIMKNPRQPFSFLANISDEFADYKRSSTKPTEIDIQLATVTKRIESSKILLEETKSYVEDIYLRAKRSDICRAWKVHDDCDDKAKEEQPC